jgi:hypothetical protein
MILSSRNGGIAQLGERLHGMQEVSGSIPLTSTKFQETVYSSPGSPSSRGLGHHPFTVSTGVRIPVGTPRIQDDAHPAGRHQGSKSSTKSFRSPSSRGLGHHPFTVSTGVRIPVGTPALQGAALSGSFVECSSSSNAALLGGIAQLGERLHGMQEVSGSIPLTSTKF